MSIHDAIATTISLWCLGFLASFLTEGWILGFVPLSLLKD